MKKRWLSLVTIILILQMSVLLASGADASQAITVESVSYDIDSGNLSYEGFVPSMGNGTVTVTVTGEDVLLEKTETVSSGKYSGMIPAGVLKRGSYRLTVETDKSGYVSGVRDFPVNGLISIKEAKFDSSKMAVTFSGITNRPVVSAHIIMGDITTETVTLVPVDGIYKGSLDVSNYGGGSMLLSVNESSFYDLKVVNIDKFVNIKSFEYDLETHRVVWNGNTTESTVSVELFDSSGIRIFGAFSPVIGGLFSGEKQIELPNGSYKLKVISIDYTTIKDEDTCIVSNIIVDTSSETDLAIYTGEYDDVTITVINGSFSDLIVQPGDSTIALVSAISSEGKLRIFGQSPGTTAVRVYAGQSEVIFNVTVSDKVLPPEICQYTFNLKIDDRVDADAADVGTSGLSSLDLLEGITLVSNGYNAGEALESALKSHGIPCDFWTGESGGQVMKHWVDQIMNLGTIKYPNGDYKYWIQYQGTSSYNQWTLGYYTEGGTFTLVYGITDVDGQVVRPDNPVQHTHSWDAGTVTKEPTCTEAGEKTYTCSCGETKTEALPSLGHDWSDWILITDATTEHDGLKERTCSRCGEKESMTIPKIVVTDNADGSQTKTEELIDGTEVTTTIGTETAVTAVSEDGTVSTTASSDTESKELVTEVKADETDGSCTVSNDTVQIAIRQQEIVSDAIGDNGKEKVLSISSATENVSASLEKGSLSDLAENDVNLRVASTQGSMTFGKDVLTSLSEKDDVTLSFSVAERSDLTESQKETIEIGSTVVSLTAMSNGQSVGSELGGKVTVVVKHTAAEGKGAVAYYVDGEGNRTKVTEQYYDAEKGEMTMVLDHFSIYVIMDEEPEQAVPYILYGLLTFVVVVCLCIMFPQVFGRKQ